MNGVRRPRLSVAMVSIFIMCNSVMSQVVAGDDGMLFENFRVPEYDENNLKKSELVGKEAVVQNNGIVDITQFQLELFKAGTNVEMRITAPQCVYNQKERIAKSKDKVKIEGDTFTVTGKDFAWDGSREVFKIFKDAKLVLQRDEGRVEQLKQGASGGKDEE